MNLRDILVQINESEMADQKVISKANQDFTAPAAATLAPNAGSGDTGTGVEDESEEHVENDIDAAVPTDGEAPTSGDEPEVAPTPSETDSNDSSPVSDDSSDDLEDDQKKQQAPVEESMSAEQKEKKEEIVKAMKSKKADFVERYGDKAEQVMHATATKLSESDDFKELFLATLSEGVDFKADSIKVKTLMESQGIDADLTEEAVQLFEESVSQIAKHHVNKIAEYAAYVTEQVMIAKLDEMEKTIDARLNEGIANWVEANQLGIEQGVRVTVAESFMDKLGSVLKEHFVHVPDFKKDLYEENLSEVQKQGTVIRESKEKIFALESELKQAQKQIFVESYVQGLSMLQKERIKELAKDLVFESEEDFKSKLSILKESISVEKKTFDSSTLVEDVNPIQAVIQESKNDYVDPYVAAISKHMGKFSKV